MRRYGVMATPPLPTLFSRARTTKTCQIPAATPKSVSGRNHLSSTDISRPLRNWCRCCAGGCRRSRQRLRIRHAGLHTQPWWRQAQDAVFKLRNPQTRQLAIRQRLAEPHFSNRPRTFAACETDWQTKFRALLGIGVSAICPTNGKADPPDLGRTSQSRKRALGRRSPVGRTGGCANNFGPQGGRDGLYIRKGRDGIRLTARGLELQRLG